MCTIVILSRAHSLLKKTDVTKLHCNICIFYAQLLKKENLGKQDLFPYKKINGTNNILLIPAKTLYTTE